MSEITLKIKPTTGSPPFEVKVPPGASIGDLKTEVSRASETPVQLIRLIYKGQVLKDESSVESYGELWGAGVRVRRRLHAKVPCSACLLWSPCLHRAGQRTCCAHGEEQSSTHGNVKV